MKTALASSSLRRASQCASITGRSGRRSLASPRQSVSHIKLFSNSRQLGIKQLYKSVPRNGRAEVLNAARGSILDGQPDRATGSSQQQTALEQLTFGSQRKPYEHHKTFARVVPVSPAYYFRTPLYVEEMTHAKGLLRQFRKLKCCVPGTERRVVWQTHQTFGEENVSQSKFNQLIGVLKRLNKIVPELRPKVVEDLIRKWASDFDPKISMVRIPTPDRYGRTFADGGRKTARAKAALVEGTGECYVNGKTLVEFFGRVHDRDSVLWALKWTNRLHRYNVWATVRGGGTTGQAEALALAVGKSLIGQEPDLKRWVRKVGCLARDRRKVERKKPGHLKARKMPAWTKR